VVSVFCAAKNCVANKMQIVVITFRFNG